MSERDALAVELKRSGAAKGDLASASHPAS
jgi:hypothetical protein